MGSRGDAPSQCGSCHCSGILVKAAVLLLALATALSGCHAQAQPEQQAHTATYFKQATTFSLHVSTPVPCSQLNQKVMSALAARLQLSLSSPGFLPKIGRVSATFLGCRDTASGWATTYSATAYSSSASQLARYMAAVVPAVNDNQCATLMLFCKYSSNRGVPVTSVLAEGVAPLKPLTSAVPLAWQPNGKKMMLPVVMGSQQQKLSVVLDTGSTTPYTTGFNWQQSTSFVNTSVPGTLVYGGAGDKTGFYCTDTATIGSITVKTFNLLVTDGDKGINGDGGGLFGFALGSYAEPGGQDNNMTSTWRQLSTAANLAGGASNRYGLWLSNNATLLKSYNDFGGWLDIGQLDANRMTGSAVWAPVVPANSAVRTNAQNNTLVWWQFTVARMAILYADGTSQTICTDCNTIADSGWPEIVITPKDAADIAIGAMTGSGPYGCGHQLLVDLGTAGSVKMNLTRDGKPPVPNCATNYNAGATFTNFQVSDLAPGVTNWYIMGLPFLRQFYTVFDFQALQIGFYTSVQA